MGLFQGFSVISLVEIFYFLVQCIKGKVSSKKIENVTEDQTPGAFSYVPKV